MNQDASRIEGSRSKGSVIPANNPGIIAAIASTASILSTHVNVITARAASGIHSNGHLDLDVLGNPPRSSRSSHAIGGPRERYELTVCSHGSPVPEEGPTKSSPIAT